MRAHVIQPISIGSERIEPGTEVDLEPQQYARLYAAGAIEAIEVRDAKKRAEEIAAKAREDADAAVAKANEDAQKAVEEAEKAAREEGERHDPIRRVTTTRLGSGARGATVQRETVDTGITVTKEPGGEKGGVPQEDPSRPGQQRPGSGEPPPEPRVATTIDPGLSHDAAHREEMAKRRGR